MKKIQALIYARVHEKNANLQFLQDAILCVQGHRLRTSSSLFFSLFFLGLLLAVHTFGPCKNHGIGLYQLVSEFHG